MPLYLSTLTGPASVVGQHPFSLRPKRAYTRPLYISSGLALDPGPGHVNVSGLCCDKRARSNVRQLQANVASAMLTGPDGPAPSRRAAYHQASMAALHLHPAMDIYGVNLVARHHDALRSL